MVKLFQWSCSNKNHSTPQKSSQQNWLLKEIFLRSVVHLHGSTMSMVLVFKTGALQKGWSATMGFGLGFHCMQRNHRSCPSTSVLHVNKEKVYFIECVLLPML